MAGLIELVASSGLDDGFVYNVHVNIINRYHLWYYKCNNKNVYMLACKHTAFVVAITDIFGLVALISRASVVFYSAADCTVVRYSAAVVSTTG